MSEEVDMNMCTGFVYLTVRQDAAYRLKLRGVKMTATYPQVVEAGFVVIKVQVRVPLSVFSALDGGTIDVEPGPSLARIVTVAQ